MPVALKSGPSMPSITACRNFLRDDTIGALMSPSAPPCRRGNPATIATTTSLPPWALRQRGAGRWQGARGWSSSAPLGAPSDGGNRGFGGGGGGGHENPLGLPRNDVRVPPQMPRRGGGLPERRKLPNVRNVVAVSSGKGGVGKSTVAVNLALGLAQTAAETTGGSQRVGILDLDIFGPSVPKLMGLEGVGEPELTQGGALLPLTNHGVPCMSMGFLLPPAPDGSPSSSTPVVWRGMMVMKATQQLLFEVDWRSRAGAGSKDADKGKPLDVLVIDMPPGTGDVALSLSQLVEVDGAVLVSTPQEVALLDARKGAAMFGKVNVPIMGLVLNMSHFISPDTGKHFPLFGSSAAFDQLAVQLGAPVLGRVPLEPAVSSGGDAGRPVVIRSDADGGDSRRVFLEMARGVWRGLATPREKGKP